MTGERATPREMATQVLFVQGAGPGVHAEWDAQLVESLRRALGGGYEVRYPAMPNEDDPSEATWRPALERELAALRPGAVVVGHSAGGTIAVHVLAGAPESAALRAIVLVAAPFVGDGGWTIDDLVPRTDLAAGLPAGVPVLLYHGEDDEVVPVAHVALYAAAIPHARVRRLPGRDHQLNDDLSEVAREIRALAPPTG